MKTGPTVRLVDTTDAAALPDLPAEIAREGLLAMSVAAGMAVMAAVFEAEIAEEQRLEQARIIANDESPPF